MSGVGVGCQCRVSESEFAAKVPKKRLGCPKTAHQYCQYDRIPGNKAKEGGGKSKSGSRVMI